MTTLGPNLKITTHAAHRDRIRDILEGALELPHIRGGEGFDAFQLGAGSIGYFFVDAPGDALSDVDARKGAWIELIVADPEATRAALGARGVEPFAYQGGTRDYFALPGGQVFRIAAAQTAS
jgi:hypothetical protein